MSSEYSNEELSKMSAGEWNPPVRKLVGYECICTVQDSPYLSGCPVHDCERSEYRVLKHHQKETKLLMNTIGILAKEALAARAMKG